MAGFGCPPRPDGVEFGGRHLGAVIGKIVHAQCIGHRSVRQKAVRRIAHGPANAHVNTAESRRRAKRRDDAYEPLDHPDDPVIPAGYR